MASVNDFLSKVTKQRYKVNEMDSTIETNSDLLTTETCNQAIYKSLDNDVSTIQLRDQDTIM